jgi:hypothetical protein
MFALTLLITLFATSVSAHTPNEAYCVQLGHQVCGVGLNGTCVHETSDFTVAFDVTDGVAEARSRSTNATAFEVYSGDRMTTVWEDCCPPDTFVKEIQCEVIEEQGQCCYTDDRVYVWGLDEHIGCVHDVVDYKSYVPTTGSVDFPLDTPLENHEVELYGGQHSNGCCACYLHAVPCGRCEERDQ